MFGIIYGLMITNFFIMNFGERKLGCILGFDAEVYV